MPASSTRAIRLFLIDDHALFRDGLARLLSGDPSLEVIGVAASADEAVARLPGLDVDVVLLDYMLGEQAAAPVVAALRERGFAGRILLVTAGLPDREAREMLAAGVAGIFHKQHAADDLKRSIREVFEGKVLIDEHYLRQLMQGATADTPPALRLTDRERQILTFLMEGLANKEMAARLSLSINTVERHLTHLYPKIGARGRTEATAFAIRHGLA